ncbi:MAG: hypothetical protein R3B47_16750 [Bacteroidia bacterium]
MLTSPCIEPPTTPGACPFVTFAYHMYDRELLSEVQISDGGPMQTEFFASVLAAGLQLSGFSVENCCIDASKYSGTIRVRFIGNVTTSACDVAIDNCSGRWQECC